MTRKQILAISRGDPELRAALFRQKNAPSGQKAKRTRELIEFNAARLAADSPAIRSRTGKGRG